MSDLLSDPARVGQAMKPSESEHPVSIARFVLERHDSCTMPIDVAQFEAALRAAIPLTALEIEDQSSGCGESFAVVLVSEVRKHLCSESRRAFSCFVFSFMRPDQLSPISSKGIRREGYSGET